MKTMRRITFLMAIMSFIAFQGFSQNTSNSTSQKDSPKEKAATNAAPGKFIDSNKDGICDNYQNKVKNGLGGKFADKNGDGICDNRKNPGQGKANCTGCCRGYQHRNGQGNGNCWGNGCGNQHRYGRCNQSAPATQPKNPTSK